MADSDEEDVNAKNENELLSCYQLLLSLLALLTKAETSKKIKIQETSLRMKQISDLVAKVATFETRQALKQKEFTQSLLHLYHASMLRTSATVNGAESAAECFALKSCLQDYTDLIVNLFDGAYEELIQGGALYLKAVEQAGLKNYGFLAGLILVSRASKDAMLKVSETLQIDCSTPKSSGSALYLLKQLLLTCMIKQENLSTLDYLLYSISQTSICEEVKDFLAEKTRLVFFCQDQDGSSMREAIDAEITQSWLQQQVIGAGSDMTRKFVYLGICVLEQSISSNAEF